ncbi:uncharacterized protein LOC126894483 isoform X2 [Daktulosphaira vitifoliae]|uniref:uncharacterized protein LOC126894483 isoform X2 n=1 Tax=Daktulosphaira vitifoliae TaxID=58002 RepID=UPI0021A9E403|nr:uncharacterized protein LOC126894483 isoform X2 [Daktulosphaira vitifoliae]
MPPFEQPTAVSMTVDSPPDSQPGSDNSDLFRTTLVSRKDELPGRVPSTECGSQQQSLPSATVSAEPVPTATTTTTTTTTPPNNRQPSSPPPLVNGMDFTSRPPTPEATTTVTAVTTDTTGTMDVLSSAAAQKSPQQMLPPSMTPRTLQVSQSNKCPSPVAQLEPTPPGSHKPSHTLVNGLDTLPTPPIASAIVSSSGLSSPKNFSTTVQPSISSSLTPYQTPPQACALSLSITNSYITPSTSQHPVLSHAASNYIPKSSASQPPSPLQHISSPYIQKPNQMLYHPPLHGSPYPPPSGYHPSAYKPAPSLLTPAASSSYLPYTTLQSTTATVSASSTVPSTATGGHLTTTAPPPSSVAATSLVLPYQPAIHAPQHYPPLYAPYRSTPYMPSTLSSAARSSRSSPMSVISTKSNVVLAPSHVTSNISSGTATNTTPSLLSSHSLLARGHSPRRLSPSRERDSYKAPGSTASLASPSPFNAASIALPPVAAPSLTPNVPASAPSSLVYNKTPLWGPMGNNSITTSTMVTTTRHPSSYPPPLFSSPAATATSQSSALPPAAPPAHNPFSAESLFQSNQADMLRRELDSRFLASSQERALAVGAPYLRTEMHHHQHQHTHVHQHTATPLIPSVAAATPTMPNASAIQPAPNSALYPPPLFKEIPKLGGVDSPFYRQSLLPSNYPGFTPSLLHSSIGHTPFTPPAHVPTFTPKLTDTSKPTKSSKPGKWNAMHVRLAWEIYHYQQKQQAAESKNSVNNLVPKTELPRPPTHLFPPNRPPHDLSPFSTPHHHHAGLPPGYPPMAAAAMFARYPTGFPPISPFPPNPINDPWARLQPSRGIPTPNSPYGSVASWQIKPDPVETERAEQQQREREREREKEREREREREKERERGRERERVKREEKRRQIAQQQLQQQQQHQQHLQQQHQHQQAVKMRERSPLKEPSMIHKEEDINMMLGRVPPPSHYLPPPPRHPQRGLPTHFSPWDQYRYDSLRFSPLIAAAAYRAEEEEHRAKLFGYHPQAHLRPKDPSPNTHRSVPPDMQLPKKEESSQSR